MPNFQVTYRRVQLSVRQFKHKFITRTLPIFHSSAASRPARCFPYFSFSCIFYFRFLCSSPCFFPELHPFALVSFDILSFQQACFAIEFNPFFYIYIFKFPALEGIEFCFTDYTYSLFSFN